MLVMYRIWLFINTRVLVLNYFLPPRCLVLLHKRLLGHTLFSKLLYNVCSYGVWGLSWSFTNKREDCYILCFRGSIFVSFEKISFHKKYGTKWYQKRSVYGTEVICHFYTVPLLQSMKISHKNNFCQLHIHRLIELQYVFCELETFRIFVACCSNQWHISLKFQSIVIYYFLAFYKLLKIYWKFRNSKLTFAISI